ncbi:hypothetical protein C0Z19_12670 [Trinickia soli]|uniref:Uncharacterized protein n=1 Tax=Trinickia soli TaxID=380675 RepID=A0A2N7W5J5_9BURK|nr:hypothetical protein CIW54_04125 [Paraburkholderia sp. T12-10]PMS24663.1 hypothetical protein C0Z19_12670 [Trinickia soli]
MRAKEDDGQNSAWRSAQYSERPSQAEPKHGGDTPDGEFSQQRVCVGRHISTCCAREAGRPAVVT